MFAKKAFARTAAYDAAISNYLSNLDMAFPPSSHSSLPMGECSGTARTRTSRQPCMALPVLPVQNPCRANQMSYNNYLDVNAGTALSVNLRSRQR